ncbi:MAG TPA: hypothetical protein HA282_01495 [Nanoarchaeota archaeon]|nr:hypothetical protein [Nanoarchaeota archaeon]HIH34787.1 hypothetical protein [Nanoarchaeota archaeon]HIH51219.1 hypothetical protein [Nanoarchaeota archaeon]HIH65873.1 hypothetical protein [Nanoarchaeota archaeon]
MARFTRKMYVIDSFELEVEAENEEDADDKLREKFEEGELESDSSVVVHQDTEDFENIASFVEGVSKQEED